MQFDKKKIPTETILNPYKSQSMELYATNNIDSVTQ